MYVFHVVAVAIVYGSVTHSWYQSIVIMLAAPYCQNLGDVALLALALFVGRMLGDVGKWFS